MSRRNRWGSATPEPPKAHPSGLVRGMLGPLWEMPAMESCVAALAFLPGPARPWATADELEEVERQIFGKVYDGLVIIANTLNLSPAHNSFYVEVGGKTEFMLGIFSPVQAVHDAVNWRRYGNSYTPADKIGWDELPPKLRVHLAPQLLVATRIEHAYTQLRGIFGEAANRVPQAVAARWLYPGVTRENLPVEAGTSDLARRWADWFNANVHSLAPLEPSFSMMRSVYAMNNLNYGQMRKLMAGLTVAVTSVTGMPVWTAERLAKNEGVLG
jgi:hypothetical protein